MIAENVFPAETGLAVRMLDSEFAERRPRPRNPADSLSALARLAGAFVDHPETMFQELVETALQVTAADSTAISLHRCDPDGTEYFEWVATAGVYAPLKGVRLPKYPSACSVSIRTQQPLHVTADQRFFDLLGVTVEPVTDGLLLPWHMEDSHGTVIILSHRSDHVFDSTDVRILQVLGNFAAMAMRHQQQQKLVLEQAALTATARMANNLAHQINNPLQSLTNIVFLAQSKGGELSAGPLAVELKRLTDLSAQLLALPVKVSL